MKETLLLQIPNPNTCHVSVISSLVKVRNLGIAVRCGSYTKVRLLNDTRRSFRLVCLWLD